MRVIRILVLATTLGAAPLATACIQTSQNGNLVRANSRYKDHDYEGTIELSDFILGQGPATPEIGAQAGLR